MMNDLVWFTLVELREIIDPLLYCFTNTFDCTREISDRVKVDLFEIVGCLSGYLV